MSGRQVAGKNNYGGAPPSTKLTAGQEGRDGVIHLQAIDKTQEEQDHSCDDPEAVRLMVDYIYLNDYTFGATAPTSDASKRTLNTFTPSVQYTHSPSFGDWPHSNGFTSGRESEKTPINTFDGALVTHSRLYGMASKYGLDALRPVAIKKFQDVFVGTWNREDLAAAISIAFNTTESTDLGLRNVIINVLVNSSTALATDPLIETAVNAIEGLPFQLFKQLSLKQRNQGSTGGTIYRSP